MSILSKLVQQKSKLSYVPKSLGSGTESVSEWKTRSPIELSTDFVWTAKQETVNMD